MVERRKPEWVVGFLMDHDADSVVLVRKNRPPWQAGKLNGVGGKVEQQIDPDLSHAIWREFREETGVSTWRHDWHLFASLTWEEGVVHFLRQFDHMTVLQRCTSTTDESIEVHRIHTLNEPGPGRANVVPNLLWLVPLAAHRHDSYDVIDILETGTTMAKPGRLDVFGSNQPGERR